MGLGNDPKNFSATVTFARDYVFRGVSQKDNKPAVQGSFDYKHPLGFYVGISGSNVCLVTNSLTGKKILNVRVILDS